MFSSLIQPNKIANNQIFIVVHLAFLCVVYQKSHPLYRFTIYKVNKASKKKREKSSAKKERKATKTLAIVLGKVLEDIFFIG
jgi:hypothetical protein